MLATAFLRALATGLVGVELGLYLNHLDLGASRTGLVIGAGLVGGALAAFLATIRADRFGRRRTLVALTLLASAGCLAAATTSSFAAVAAASFAGMLNGMGRDRGAALVVEQAMLPATATHETRTRAFAWYNVVQDVGHALGSLLAGLPTLLAWMGWADGLAAHRVTMLVAAAVMLAPLPLYLGLGARVEIPASAQDAAGRLARRLRPESRRLLVRISALFAIDSLAGGILVTSLLSYFFFERFAATEATIGALFFGARLLNAVSHLGAAWLAHRIGLVNTMVFTHIPSSLLLVTVAYAPTFPIAAALFLLREGLVEMDVPTRQSYVMAVMRPEEATTASGVTSLVRLGAWSVGPVLAGFFMQSASLMTPLLVGAGMKIAYDILLWRAFRGVPPPEEAARATA